MLFRNAAGRPVKIKRHTMASFVGASLLAFHAGIENFFATGRSVVRSINKDRVVLDSKFFDQLASLTDVVVDIGNHAIESSDLVGLIFIHVEVFLRTMQRTMRSVG